jgi:hypothetical protein
MGYDESDRNYKYYITNRYDDEPSAQRKYNYTKVCGGVSRISTKTMRKM